MSISNEQHTVKRFDQELKELQALILEMGGLVEDQIHQSVSALHEENTQQARDVIERDHNVNLMEVKIDEQIINLIALRQPMASDLRMVISLSKAVTDLERIGDEAEKISRMSLRLYEQGNNAPQPRLLRDIQNMSKLASSMLRDSLDALARLDAEQALKISRGDTELDAQYGDALRRLVTYMMEDPRTIGHAIDVMFVIKALERIGDHAKNIAEYIIFLVKGKDIRHLSTEDAEDVVRSS